MRVLFFLLISWHFSVGAQSLQLDSISDQDLETIVKEFSTGFVHTTATPPTSLGKVFGAELAMLFGANESPGIEAISQRIDPQSEFQYMPHMWFVGGVSVPYGISIEVNFVPDVGVQGVEVSHKSAGLKWSVTDQFFENLPFDLAIRTYVSQSELSFEQTVSNGSFPATSNVRVGFENTMIGGDTLLGFDLPMVEPYFGIGFVQTSGELTGTATTSTPYSIFDDLSSQTKKSDQSSMRFIAGASLHLALMNVGIEYTNLFSTHRLSVKVGLQF